MTRIEEEKEVMEKERQEMLENLEKHKELERQQREQIRKVYSKIIIIIININYLCEV